MAELKGFGNRCAVLASGLVGSVLGTVVLGGGGPIVGALLAGPTADLLKDLFKGLSGDHLPRLSKDIQLRLASIDPTTLNHHLQKALVAALEQTEAGLRFRYKDAYNVDMPRDDQSRLKAFCVAMKDGILKGADHQFTQGDLDRILEEPNAALSAIFQDHVMRWKGREGADRLFTIVQEHFHEDLHLHFAEHIKDPDHHEARVALERLTADAVWKEVRQLLPKLAKMDATLGEVNTKLDRLLGGESTDARTHFAQNAERMAPAFATPASLLPVVSSSVDHHLMALQKELSGITRISRNILDDTTIMRRDLRETRTTAGTIKWMSSVVIGLLVLLTVHISFDPLHLRSFPIRIGVDQPLDHGSNDRVARRIAIWYSDGSRDTALVTDGVATFHVPERLRNDDAVFRLLCRDSGQTDAEQYVCDSARFMLSDRDRLQFPSLTGSTGTVPPGSKISQSPERDRSGNISSNPDVAAAKAPPCPIDGLEFLNEGSLEDHLVLTGYSGGTVAISGELNRKQVSGQLRVNGNVLTVIKGTGTLTDGRVELGQDCGALKGALTILSMSGTPIPETVSMRNASR